MAYSVRRKPESTKEIQFSNRLAKLLTEDMGLNLEAVGFHLVHNHPVIVPRRLEVVSLTAGEEYDKLMTGYLGEDYTELWK
ncbi:MAG: hypothetical protein AN484_00840 [Aphanizomenon flos-aquae WA102]|jgi:hypothetical protein|uniref:Uncharacterized protein n=1 Tax=Aphanizomenon flos-aquae WA102 TaxID=1710896 RepID=A0A1B7X8A0_APHFL|nr:MAG: hypothetical protein AN484_00840 [Aphanizomenon flos-aquae WA102]